MEGGIKFAIGRRKPGEKFIVRSVTDDGLVGFDQFDQFAVTEMRPDGSEVSHHIADVRGDICVICNRSWEHTGPSMSDQMRWQISNSFVHLSCYIRHDALVQRQLFWSSLVENAVRFRGLDAEANPYWPPSDPWAKQPWYSAELVEHSARFVFGRRKRVYHVEVAAQGGTKLEWREKASEVFKDDVVTKEFGRTSVMLHAWSEEKLREYVRKISEVAGYQSR